MYTSMSMLSYLWEIGKDTEHVKNCCNRRFCFFLFSFIHWWWSLPTRIVTVFSFFFFPSLSLILASYSGNNINALLSLTVVLLTNLINIHFSPIYIGYIKPYGMSTYIIDKYSSTRKKKKRKNRRTKIRKEEKENG